MDTFTVDSVHTLKVGLFMVYLTAENYTTVLNSYYGCTDSVLNRINIEYILGEKAKISIWLECRYRSDIENLDEWINLVIEVYEAEESFTALIRNVSNRIISDGVKIIESEGRKCIILQNSGTEVDNFNDLAYANIYFFGTDIQLRVNRRNEN